jgi:predicted TIM-barrel fold metal-dependent hydrolase
LLTRELLNVDHLMWGSDYPHTEGTFPRSSAQVSKDFAGLEPELIEKLVRENCRRLYGLN